MIKVLSLHFTNKCNINCPFCYIPKNTEQRSLEWFMDFPKVAKELEIEQIALGGGEPLLYPEFIVKFGEECNKFDVICNLTTNGILINNDIIDYLRHLTMISFSIDRYKQKSYKELIQQKERMKLVKENTNCKIGANILLLDNYTLKMLPLLINLFNDVVDSYYILQKKPSNGLYTDEDLKTSLYPLSVIYKDHIFFDHSLLLRLNKIDYCCYGKDIVSITPNGEVCPCSFAKPINILNTPSELISFLQKKYPLKSKTSCPFV